MDIGVISVRYARALLKSSVQTGCDEKVYHDMVTFTKSFVEVPKLRHTINNPTLSQEQNKGHGGISRRGEPRYNRWFHS